MRAVHVGLAALVATVILIAWFERKPTLQDFDPVRDAPFKDTWNSRVHLAYWEKWGSFEAEACQTMVDEFNRSQTEIFVHHLRTSQVDRKAMLAAIGGDPPDLVGLWDYNLIPFAEGGALMPLDDFMKRSGLTEDYYIPNYFALCKNRGKVYALPTTPASVALFYNKEHFRRKAKELRAAGLDPDRAPRTIEELDRYAAVLNEFYPDGTPRIMGFLPAEPPWFNHAWGYYFGGTLMDPHTGRITADDPGNVRAYLWIKQCSERYGRAKVLRFLAGFGTFDSPFNAFIDGRVSMEMQGVWFPMFIRRHRPQMEYGVAPFPCAEGAPGVATAKPGYALAEPGPRSLLEADIIAIPRGCKHPEEAWKFIYWVQTKGLEILCRLHGKHMPIRHPPAWFREGHPNPEIDVFEKVALAPDSFISPRIIVWQEYRDQVVRAFEHIWNWPVPEEKLVGLTGAARQKKVDELCEAEVQATLAAVRENIQKALDTKTARAQREERGDP